MNSGKSRKAKRKPSVSTLLELTLKQYTFSYAKLIFERRPFTRLFIDSKHKRRKKLRGYLHGK